MNYVLDASAVLCLVLEERGQENVVSRAKGASITSVNMAEVWTRLIDLGTDAADLDTVASTLRLTIVPFDAALARVAADLRHGTRPAGLSLGDRACLALALRLGATALTADRKWSDLDLGVEVEQIR